MISELETKINKIFRAPKLKIKMSVSPTNTIALNPNSVANDPRSKVVFFRGNSQQVVEFQNKNKKNKQ